MYLDGKFNRARENVYKIYTGDVIDYLNKIDRAENADVIDGRSKNLIKKIKKEHQTK